MDWFYAEGNQQRGPVSDEQLAELARSGKLQPGSLVWREGMSNWQPYSSTQPAAPPVLAPPLAGANTAACAECGHNFSTNDMVHVQKSWVCAACKPIFLQRLHEGAPPPVSMTLWRSGKLLVTAKDASFPDRCVKCNAPANGGRLKRTLYWYPSYVLLLILLSLLIGLIVAMIVRKTAKIEIGLCEQHRAKRVRGIAIGAVLGLGGFAGLIASLANSWGWLALLCFVAFIGGIVFMARGALVSAKRMDTKFVWIKGVCAPYLDMLPEWRDGV